MGQSGEFLARRLGPLLKTGLPLMKDVLQPLARSILIPLVRINSSSINSKMQLFKIKFLDLVCIQVC